MDNKSPGPDGRTAAFWLETWEEMGPALLILTEAIEAEQAAPASLVEGIIRMLAKAGDPANPADYRPITLLNIHYKIITKAYANRWRIIAPEYFSLHQLGFVPTRFIGDHIRLVMDTREHWKLAQKKGAWLFLDFQKAYDRIDWSWLHRVLTHIGAGPRFLGWMKALYDTEHAPERRIILNDGWSNPIKTTRGTAQGCPLSPFLFNIVVEFA